MPPRHDGCHRFPPWHDQNGDGIKDNPPIAIAGVHIELLDASNNVVLTTNSTGAYEFTGLSAGTYRVTFEILDSPYEFTLKDVGSNDAVDNDANRTTGWTDQFTVSAGEVKTNVDGGYRFASGSPSPPPGGVGGLFTLMAGGGDLPERELEWHSWNASGAQVPLHGYYVEYADDEFAPVMLSDDALAIDDLQVFGLDVWLAAIQDIGGWFIAMRSDYNYLLGIDDDDEYWS